MDPGKNVNKCMEYGIVDNLKFRCIRVRMDVDSETI